MKERFKELHVELTDEIIGLIEENILIGDPILLHENIVFIPFFEMHLGIIEGQYSNSEGVGTGLEISPKAILMLKDGKSEVFIINKRSNIIVTEKILDVTI